MVTNETMYLKEDAIDYIIESTKPIAFEDNFTSCTDSNSFSHDAHASCSNTDGAEGIVVMSAPEPCDWGDPGGLQVACFTITDGAVKSGGGGNAPPVGEVGVSSASSSPFPCLTPRSSYPSVHAALHTLPEHLPRCPLCSPQHRHPSLSRLRRHFLLRHAREALQTTVQGRRLTVLKCRRRCRDDDEGAAQGRESGGHFHCPVCHVIVSEAEQMKLHLSGYSKQNVQMHRKHKRRRLAPSHLLNSPMHQSITCHLYQFLSRLSLPRCPLCSEVRSYLRRQSLLLHVHKYHLHKAVKVLGGGVTLMCCRLYCDRRTRCHYHCPRCDFLTPRAALIRAHVVEHLTRDGGADDEGTNDTAPDEGEEGSFDCGSHAANSRPAGEHRSTRRLSERCETMRRGTVSSARLLRNIRVDVYPGGSSHGALNTTGNDSLDVTTAGSSSHGVRYSAGGTVWSNRVKTKEDPLSAVDVTSPSGMTCSDDALGNLMVEQNIFVIEEQGGLCLEECDGVSLSIVKLENGSSDIDERPSIDYLETDRIIKQQNDLFDGDSELQIHEIKHICDEKPLIVCPPECLPQDLQEAFDRLSGTSCYLCYDSAQRKTPLELEVHFYRAHVRHSVPTLPGTLVLVCALQCGGRHDPHLHCPQCGAVLHLPDTAVPLQQPPPPPLLLLLQHCRTAHPGLRLVEELEGVGCSATVAGSLCDGVNELKWLRQRQYRKDVRHIKADLPPLLAELLMLEPDADWSFLSPSFPRAPRSSLVPDALSLYRSLQPLHCPLCDDGREHRTARALQVHFHRSHVKRAHSTCPVPALMCRLSCKGFSRGHYHCAFCLYVIHDLTKLRVHQQKLHGGAVRKAWLCRYWGRTIELCRTEEEEAELEKGGIAMKTCEGGFVKGKNKVADLAMFVKPASVVSSLEEIRSQVSLPDCLLCRSNQNFITEKRLHTHLMNTHIKQALHHPPLYIILCCRLYNTKYRDRGHYHCPLCHYLTHDKGILSRHLTNHSKKEEACRREEDAVQVAQVLNPDRLEQYRVVLQSSSAVEREEVQAWQLQFNHYLRTDFAVNHVKPNSCVMSHHRRKKIIDYLLFAAPLEPSLVRYVNFKNYAVIALPELNLRNCLVEPFVSYKHTGLALTTWESASPAVSAAAATLYRRYRRVACIEEFFRVLHELHVRSDSEHVPAGEMMVMLRARFVFFPRIVVLKFLELCPVCRPGLSSRSRHNSINIPNTNQPSTNLPIINQNTVLDAVAMKTDAACDLLVQDGSERVAGASGVRVPGGGGRRHSQFMTALQVNLIDISKHPDELHRYIVHCQDRHTLLHLTLFPLPRPCATLVAQGLARRVLCSTGLPLLVSSNIGTAFVREVLGQLAAVWHEPLGPLNHACPDVCDSSEDGLDSADVIEVLTSRLMSYWRAGRPAPWSSWLPHVLYTLNTRAGQQELTPYQLAFHRRPPPPCVSRAPLARKQGARTTSYAKVMESSAMKDKADFYSADDTIRTEPDATSALQSRLEPVVKSEQQENFFLPEESGIEVMIQNSEFDGLSMDNC